MSQSLIRIVHLGLGRFHRAHQAVYFNKLNQFTSHRADLPKYAISAFSMRTPDAADELSNDLRYPVIALGPDQTETVWVESIQETGFILRDRLLFLKRMGEDSTAYVTLTVTEKGYCLSNDGKLDWNNAWLAHDLAHPLQPKSTIGLLALGLRERDAKTRAPLTILSCDNMRDNSKKLGRAVADYMQRLGWDFNSITSQVVFLNTVVDRIVPSLTEALSHECEAALYGQWHASMVATEPFSQWIIETPNNGTINDWPSSGVQFTSSVKTFEEMKLFLLNSSHSLLAYRGLLRGYTFVHEAFADPDLHRSVQKLMLKEVAPLLTGESAELASIVNSYCDSISRRFENHRLPHALSQIATDGSQKLPIRIFQNLFIAHSAGHPRESLLECVGAWLAYLYISLIDESEVSDPQIDRFKSFPLRYQNSWVKAALNDDVLFGAIASQEVLKNEIALQFDQALKDCAFS